jgi:putative membrane protein insertion efficiency factor
MRTLLIAFVQLYRWFVSPLLGRNCRFYPSCSSFALEALERHGAVHGTWLATCRVCRCHPWNPGGYDPVPEPITDPFKRPSHG